MICSWFIFLAAFSTSEACHSIAMEPMQQMPQNMIELMPEPLALMNREYTTTQLAPRLYTTSPVTRLTRRILPPAVPYTTTRHPLIVFPSVTTTRHVTLITTTQPTTTTTSMEKLTTTSTGSSVKWTCLSAMVQIETIHAWDELMKDRHHHLLSEDLKKLEQHSGTTLASFGDIQRKIASVSAAGGERYGELFFIKVVLKPCKELKEFVRKAVSWSKDIPRAVVACGCETPVEIYKL
ncbi:hypothetical protein Y032_0006g3160 [Ancylostoma ceylanicum]|uniref:Uncharacterized protein n=1 Tax=Ancylostoma ceylanicum TaxID=53326 RepID=A0A016VQ86_9BILA|nr:hypothetical protein Y032_0006g3160 [Ancylostoma ceylanicum]